MKKNKNYCLALIGMLLITMTSCNKSFDCECDAGTAFGAQEEHHTIHARTKSRANDKCQGYETSTLVKVCTLHEK